MPDLKFPWDIRAGRRFPLFCAVIAVAAVAITLAACSKAAPSRVEFALNTVCSVTLYDEAKDSVYRDIFSRIREIENRMSAYLAETDIARVNAAAGKAPVRVNDDVFEVVERAVYYAELSGGAFDPTIGTLTSIWGIGGNNPRVPSQAEIDAVLPLVNWRNIELDRERRSVFLKQPGMVLDLGAIAKGYAADEAAAIIRKARIGRAIIDLGGDVLTCGVKPDKSPWRVGLQDPYKSRGAYIGVVTGAEKAMATSGVYERYFDAGGVRYHHLFSPSDGYPADNGLLSVTIIADRSMDADALSTASFILGYENGRALVDSLEGVEAVFVFRDMNVRKTGGANFTLTDESYRLLAE